MQLFESQDITIHGTRITGIAITPRVSRNEVLYLPDELAKNDGKIIPINLMHKQPIEKIGEARLSWDKDKLRLMYEGTITDPHIAQLVKQKELFVSIGASFKTENQTCGTNQCYKTPLGLDIDEISIVDTPGIPEATLNVLEHYLTESFTSLVSPKSKTNHMVTTKITEQEQSQEIDCGPGKKPNPDDPTQCIPIDDAESTCGCNKDEQNKPEVKEPKVKIDLEPIKNELQKGLDELAKEIGVIKQDQKRATQITKVSTEDGNFSKQDMTSLAHEWVQNINRNGSYSWEVDLTPKEVHERIGYSNPFDYKRKDYRVTEALSFTQGDVSNEIGSTSIISLPGGKYQKSIRDLVNYQEIPKGADTFTLYKGDQPDEQTVTEGRTTAAAEAAQDTFTITPVDMTANTTTGYYTQITKTQIQKSPIAFMTYLNAAAKNEAMHREGLSCFNTTVDAVAAPTNWVDATDGSVVADQTAEDAVTGTFDPKAISKGVELLGDAGYIDAPHQAFAAITWKQYRELLDDADLIRWTQEGKATLTETGQLATLYGVDIIPVPKTLIQETASNTLRAVMGKKKHTFWMASGRNISIESQKEIKKLTVDVSMDKQINSGLIDEASLVVLCSSA